MDRTEIAQLSFDCVLPSAIFFNDNLEPNCIKLYAIIRNLTKMHGYCYAANEYLAQLMASDLRSVQRWIQSLKSEGYLELKQDGPAYKTQRYIYLSDKFKKSLRDDKIVTPPMTKLSPPHDKIVTQIDKSIEKEEEYLKERESTHTSKETKLEFGKVKFTKSEYEKIVRDFGEPKVRTMIDRLNEYAEIKPKRFKEYASHVMVLRKWIREDSEKREATSWKTKNKYQIGYTNSKPNSSANDLLAPVFATPEQVKKIFGESTNG